MSEPNPDGSDPDEVDALIAKMKNARLRYRNLPRDGALEIVEEAVGRLLALPGLVPIEEKAIALADSGVSALLMGIPIPVANIVAAAAGAKGVDLALHALIAWLEHKAQLADLAAAAERRL